MILPESANTVVLASNYNPSIVSKDWLYQKDIFVDTVRNFVHTPVLSLVESEESSLVVEESRLQFTLKKVTQDNLSILATIPMRFVRALPETPYKAVGLNYYYLIPKHKFNLNTILTPRDRKLRTLLSPTYELGATAVFQFEKFIVTLTISPLLGRGNQIQIRFNFHSEALGVSEVGERLGLQMKIVEKAESIVTGVCKNA